MAMVINSNIMSLNAQRNLTLSQGDLNQSMERLTSGKRINSAGDDAAGLAISNRMTSQVRGLDQAIRNANDGISLIQTAEGALDETTNILQRMRELSIQSANGTYDDGNRATLNAEVQQLIQEIDRISETTKFNGLQILDGTLGQVDLQAGADANETIALEIGTMDSKSLGGVSGDLVGEEVTAVANLRAAVNNTGASITVNDQAISTVDAAATVQETLDSINADLDGFGAEASTLVEWTALDAGDGVLLAGTDALTIAVADNNGNTVETLVLTDTDSMDELVDKINESSGFVSASLTDDNKLQLVGEDIATVTVTGDTAQAAAAGGNSAAAAAVATNYSVVFDDTSADGRGVKIEATGTAAADVSTGLGIDLNDDNGNLLSANINTAAAALNDLNDGDLIINGVEIGAIDGGTSQADSVSNTVEAINKLSDETGVVAYASGSGLALRSSNQEEISVEYADTATDADVLALTGLQERNTLEGAGSIASVDISTAAGAQRAIDVIDSALDEISSTRGDLGAINNRLDFTINNLSNVSENVAAARSRIEDADFAKESAALSRAQVLQQAGTAMLAQANAAPQQVLSLLQ
ncbi:flagellin [uncultured Neptuniibacter sp.]|uniref:flagellin N-terminal helical domain-containing protein n=1 Tax=uncultured Neptuniibacter sp. TaxID=502143 RepID=UPI002637A350|nr:flagellin [uncultured Neptuniibacter sp.]